MTRQEVDDPSGARAVEIAALFEDTVIAVKHLTDPASGKMSRTTRALFISGGLALGAAVGAFVFSFVQVALLRRAWAATHDTPFQLAPGGVWLDVAAFAALGFGVYALAHAAARLVVERRRPDFVVGDAPFADVAAPLVRSTGAGWELVLDGDMRADLSIAGAPPQPLASGARAIAPGERACVDVGALRFLVASVGAPARLASRWRIDWSQEAYVGATAVIAGVFLALLWQIPPDPKSLALDELHSELVAHYIIKAPEPPPLEIKNQKGAGGGAGGAAHEGPSGKLGKDQNVKRDTGGTVKVKGPRDNPDPRVTRELANRAAQNMGINAILRGGEGSSLGSIFTRESAIGNDAETILTGLRGSETGESWGNGLGAFGDGPGGGGHAKTIGAGDLRVIGPGGPGRHGGDLPGVHSLKPGDHKVGNIEPLVEPKVHVGDIDKAIIKRVIRAHRNEVAFCYEKELLKKSELYGRVMARFVINANGKVIDSKVENTTVHDAAVEGCIAQAVTRWEFPAPSHGVVVVSYPFVLKAAGGQ